LETKSHLLLPPKELSSCIAAAIYRDTRGVYLSETDRFNYFPASPLVSVTSVIAGELRLISSFGDLQAARNARPIRRHCVLPPQEIPTASWSTGPIVAVTIGFFPEAWKKLGFELPSEALSDTLEEALSAFDDHIEVKSAWVSFCEAVTPRWNITRSTGGLPDWTGSDRVADWVHHLAGRLAVAGAGRSVRAIERRIRHWTGQTRHSLDFYAGIENLHRLRAGAPNTSLAELATDAGFADQSHMGRALRRATGFSPAQLNRLIENEEAFWCYRLMGKRF
jgi:AraC-like DNA-binding protein